MDAGADAEMQGAVAHFLFKDQIRHLQNRGLWPAAFGAGRETQAPADNLLTSNPNHVARPNGGDESESEEDDSDLMPNPNRRPATDSEDEAEEDEQEEGDAEEATTSQAQGDMAAAAAVTAACTS